MCIYLPFKLAWGERRHQASCGTTRTCRPIGTFLVNPQLRSRKRAYDIVYSAKYSMPESNDIAQVFCRQDCLFYFFLMAFRVSPEILGGRPERVRVCRPAMPSFRYRLCHLTPHDGAMPRKRAAPVRSSRLSSPVSEISCPARSFSVANEQDCDGLSGRSDQ